MKLDDLPAQPVRSPASDAAWERIYAAACAPYRPQGQWSYQWARGKLARDPVFRGMLERGHLADQPRVVDIGCGQGLVAALLHACATVGAADWPAEWRPAPLARSYTGIELMQRDADRARAALHALPLAPQFICGDMCSTPLRACDLFVILDVL
ncbi:MAG TPA: methyltransferase type 11, partial [Rubrivivax sp.]|nr:methyltransferase type 11 [Rubrivivax sp.]